MQLSTIKVSNILSFPYVENLTTIEGVKFHNHENGVINIMIGPNGSGKSNLLDIIHAVRKYGITINYLINNDSNSIPYITKNNNIQHNLTKHHGQEKKKSHIYLSIILSQDDYNNLFFLIKNQSIINMIIKEYSNININFSAINKEDILKHSNKIPFYFTINKDNNLELEKNEDIIISFIYEYFQNFELIQICINIYNRYRKNKVSDRYPLRNTFALITSETTISQSHTNKAIHLFCKKINSIQKQYGEKSMFENFFIESLNTTLEEYTGFRLCNINQLSETYFSIINNDGYIFSYEEISSGEQSFLALILLIYSHDLHNGFLIIDEPELHLHPQSQKKFLNLIEEMKEKQHIQYIIATHSPTMINEHNINHVFRCSKKNNQSQISCNQGNFGEDEATLLQMLKFDYIAKIFFVDTIILVEGETDMYFLSHLIEYLGSLPERSERISNYEIITISGKGGVKRRKQFLRKFNNNVFYIGDRDNTIEYNILSQQELSNLPHNRLQNNKGSKYAGIVEYIKKNKSDLYTRIIQGIQYLYKNNIFLLTQGDLESYTGMQSKGLDDTVNFCLHQFTTWIDDNHFQDKRKELFFIIESIFSQKG